VCTWASRTWFMRDFEFPLCVASNRPCAQLSCLVHAVSMYHVSSVARDQYPEARTWQRTWRMCSRCWGALTHLQYVSDPPWHVRHGFRTLQRDAQHDAQHHIPIQCSHVGNGAAPTLSQNSPRCTSPNSCAARPCCCCPELMRLVSCPKLLVTLPLLPSLMD
jgi:hypothetical protein